MLDPAIYRIIYTIEDNILTITVIKIGHRREIYNR
ncbi:MAG: type II toxin-antitoxin system RelE family toxin [Bacteroidota bacterium]